MNNAVRNTAFMIFMFVIPSLVLSPPLSASVKSGQKKQYPEGYIRAFELEVISERQAQKNSNEDPAWASIRSKTVHAQPLTLTELVDIALQHNPNTRKVWGDIQVSEFEKKKAQSQLYPQVNVSAAANRQKISAAQSYADLDDLSYGPAFQITYLLFDFGGRSANIEEAAKNIVSANYQLNQSIQDLLLDVETAYYDFYSATSNLQAAKADFGTARKVFYSAEQRFNVGLASKLDVLQAKANFEDSLYSLEDAKVALKDAKANLAKVVGLPADSKFDIAMPTKEVPTQINEKDVSSLIEEAIEKRADISSGRAILKAKEAAVKAANSALWPTVSLGGSAQANRYKYFGGPKADNSDSNYGAYATVNWDVFDGFYNISNKRQAESSAAVEYENLIATELEVSAEVWSKYYGFNSAVSKLRYSRAFYNTSNASYEMALESYNTGLKSILDLLDAQSKLADARGKLIQSKRDVFVALAGLAHSTGSLYVKEIRSNE